MANFAKILDFEKSRQIPIKFDSAAKFEGINYPNYSGTFLISVLLGYHVIRSKGGGRPKPLDRWDVCV